MASKIAPKSVLESITNQVLRQDSAKKGTIYYLPCYVRLKVKAITEMSLEERKGSFSGTLIFSFYYEGLPEEVLDQFTTGFRKEDQQLELKDWKKRNDLKKAILLQFARQETIQLRQEKDITQQIDEDKKIVTFTVRKEFVCELEGEVYYTPFEIINLYLSVTIQTLPLYEKQNHGKSVAIKFNCMKNDDISILGCSSKIEFGLYSIAVGLLDTKYHTDEESGFKEISFCRCKDHSEQDNLPPSIPKKKKESSQNTLNQNEEEFNSVIKLKPASSIEEQKPQIGQSSAWKTAGVSPTKMKPRRLEKLPDKDEPKKKEGKVKAFQYAHFRIPLFKNPAISVFSIFVPLWVIGFINLFIFFQERGLSGRIASIAVMTLAYIAFIPTINDQIPQTPTIKLVEILILMEIVASALCLIQSFIYKDETGDYIWQADGFFIAALILTALTFVIQMAFLVIHAVYWKGKYTKEITRANGDKKKIGIDVRQNWGNKDCDREFKSHIDNRDVQPLILRQT